MLTKSKPEDAKQLWKRAQQDVEARFRLYEYLSQRKAGPEPVKAAD
jgi:pyruvate-ferredoxin/flavodoxin oxidoreductase